MQLNKVGPDISCTEDNKRRSRKKRKKLCMVKMAGVPASRGMSVPLAVLTYNLISLLTINAD